MVVVVDYLFRFFFFLVFRIAAHRNATLQIPFHFADTLSTPLSE